MSYAFRPPAADLEGTPPIEGSRPPCLWNPVGFDPVATLGEPLRKRADLARFVVHKVIWANVFNASVEDGFARLKAEYLRKFFPDSRTYALVIARLTAGGAIVCDDRYVKGEKCLGYKLGPALAPLRHQRVPITDLTLAKRVVRQRAAFPKTLTGVHRHLYDHLRTVEIDRAAAIDWLLQGEFEPCNETVVELLHARQFHFTVCPYGRVHTNLTNLKSGLRRFLTVRGERLVNLDIRNAQPLIFAALLKRRYEFDPAQTEVPAPADVIRYVELVQAGRFYDALMESSDVPAGRRAEFKRNFFGRVFFCKNRPITPEAEAFGAAFPNVFALVLDKKAEDYAALAHELQREESALMIGGVAARCMAEIPHAFIGTIHDSVLTTPRHADAVKAIMTDEFRKVGLTPTIREERAEST